MNAKALAAFTLVAAACNLHLAAAEQAAVPPGWVATPNVGTHYQISYDQQAGAYCLQNLGDPERAVGGFSQAISAQPYHGKNVVFSAEIREDRLDGGSELFLRAKSGPTTRSGAGWRDVSQWTRVQVQIGAALDSKTETLDFGILLQGKGRVCMRNAQIEASVAKPAKADNMPLHNEVAIVTAQATPDNLAVRP